jgi:hypothetical protein
MTSYRVYLRSDIQWAMRTFKARSPQHAVKLARQFAEEHFDELDFEDYEPIDNPIDEIEVHDQDGNELAAWYDEDLRIRLAARDLLEAAEKVIARWERGDLAEAVRELDAAVAKAKEGAG